MDAEQRSQSPFLLETKKNTAVTERDQQEDETNSTFRDEGNEDAPELLFKPAIDDPPLSVWKNQPMLDAERRSESPFLLETKNTAVTERDEQEDETSSTFRDEGNEEEPPELLFKPAVDDPPLSLWQKHRLVIWGATAIFCIVLVGALVAILVHSSSLGNNKDKNAVLTDDYYNYASSGDGPSSQPDVFEPNDNSPATAQAPPTSDTNTALLKSLEDTIELYAAVDEYLATASAGPQSLVAQTYGWPISTWDVSRVTHLDYLFDGTRVGANATLIARFNEPLNGWDTANVVSMAGTFQRAISFNQPLDGWNVAKVTNFELMFHEAHAFNGDISNWQTGSATNFWSMFDNAMSFNQDISNWSVGSVTSFHSMFYGASALRQNLCGWGLQMKSAAYRSLSDMFTWAESCPAAQAPVMTWSPPGPFCFDCE